jgi:Bacterial regulatory helix-turn-helix protein, lysR family
MNPQDRIGRRLSLRDLNMFLVVAELRSMSKAAVQLAISQSSASHCLIAIPAASSQPSMAEL